MILVYHKAFFLSSFNIDPEPSAEEPSRYKQFGELYGKNTTEQCPSLKQTIFQTPEGVDLPEVKMNAETVRDFINCLDRGKPRLIWEQIVVMFGTHLKIKYLIIHSAHFVYRGMNRF